ncbi:MAG: hypothetical protein ACKOUM_05820 [Sphingopyxis sp.]
MNMIVHPICAIGHDGFCPAMPVGAWEGRGATGPGITGPGITGPGGAACP